MLESKYIFPLRCSHPEHDPPNPEDQSISTSLVFINNHETQEMALKFANIRINKDNPLCRICKGPLTIRQDLSDLIYRP